MTTDGELWHIVEARRDDGTPTMFRIRELEPQKQLTRIFVVELPYPKTELSRLPTAADYRRLTEFDEQWLHPASSALGWEVVGHKIEDGSFFLYMYGAGDPNTMIEKLSPFDASLGFYDDEDPDWQEYSTLRDLLDQAKAIPATDPTPAVQRQRAPTTAITSKPPATTKPAEPRTAKARPAATVNTVAKTQPAATVKTTARPAAKTKAKPAAKAKRGAPAKPTARTKARSVAKAAKTAKSIKSTKSTKTTKTTKTTKSAKTKSKPQPATRTGKRKRR